MTQSEQQHAPTVATAPGSTLRKAALRLTVGALIASAVLGGVFIILGDQSGIAARAWLTLGAVTLFALAAMADGVNSDGPNRWYLATSTALNVFLLAVALVKLWNGPLQPADTVDAGVWVLQVTRWLCAVAVVRAALLLSQLYTVHFFAGLRAPLSRMAGALTLTLVWLTACVFVVPLSFPNLQPIGLSGYPAWWWRTAGATTLVMAVSIVIPLIVRVFEPKAPRPLEPMHNTYRPGANTAQPSVPTQATLPPQAFAAPPNAGPQSAAPQEPGGSTPSPQAPQ